MLRQFSTAPVRVARLVRATQAPVFSSRLAQLRSPTVRLARPLSVSSRWWSDKEAAKEEAPKEAKAEAKADSKAKAKEETKAEATEEAGEPLSAAEAAALRKELAAKSQETIEWRDKYLRSVADFRNLQERTKREMKAARDFAITQFAKDLVDSVDNLDRALAMVPQEKLDKKDEQQEAAVQEALQDLVNLVDGLRMTETVLLQTLKKHGLERFDPEGEKFDPNEHEATFMTPNKEREHNTVLYTQQKGFRLNGRVLRAAKVGVVNNK